MKLDCHSAKNRRQASVVAQKVDSAFSKFGVDNFSAFISIGEVGANQPMPLQIAHFFHECWELIRPGRDVDIGWVGSMKSAEDRSFNDAIWELRAVYFLRRVAHGPLLSIWLRLGSLDLIRLALASPIGKRLQSMCAS